jgi:ribosomal protein S18 acetylase RimI-like enzyme
MYEAEISIPTSDFLTESILSADPLFFDMIKNHVEDLKNKVTLLAKDSKSDLSYNWIAFDQTKTIGLLGMIPYSEVHSAQLYSLKNYLDKIEKKQIFHNSLKEFFQLKGRIDDPSSLYLTRIFVKQENRGIGIADKLIDFLISYQFELGMTSCTLHVHRDNQVAIDLYLRHRFKWIDCNEKACYWSMVRS